MNTIASLPQFNRVHKKKSTYKMCPPNLAEKYRGRLPEILISTWIDCGFQEFSDGFLWTVNPDEFSGVISDFLYEQQIEQVDVVFRTAYGDMVLYYNGSFVHFSAVTMRHSKLTGKLESILEMDLGQPRFLNSIFFFDLFKKALKRLGKLSEDDVYGFVPAPAIGGAINPDNLGKFNLRTHLHYLAQLQARS